MSAPNSIHSAPAAAHLYVSFGWEPIPLRVKEKKPQGPWKNPRTWTPQEIDQAFSADSNVGIALGARSGGLIDVDFDWPEAAELGRTIFDHLPAFGRVGSPLSHRLALADLKENVRFQIPGSAANRLRWDRAVVLELRGDQLQTMVPPSVHPSGETVEWQGNPAAVPRVDAAELEQRAALVAFLAVILKAYPGVAGNRDNACLALTGALVMAGVPVDEVDRLVTTVAILARDDGYRDRGGKASATRDKHSLGQPIWGLPKLCELLDLQDVEATLRDWLHPASVPATAIALLPGRLPDAIDAAEAALIAADVEIFQRGEDLVRLVRLPKGSDESGVIRDGGAVVIKAVSPQWLREQFARAANWQRLVGGRPKRVDPPLEMATTYIARVGEWNVRVLQGVIHSPTLRPDYSLLQTKGFDTASGLYFEPSGVEFPEISDAPTRDEAEQAFEQFLAPFKEFCFADEASKSVALAAALTALVRPMFRSAPMIAIDAPTAGTGKSILAETISCIATGHKPAMMTQGKSDEENEKRLASVLMAGDQVIVIDNCERPLEGDFLCSMLTQELVQPRILGKSETRRLPTRCLVMATGNNLTLAGDITRRALICRLDAKTERPDRRQYPFDPTELALERRPEIVMAGLTILRAYIVAGEPEKLDKLGSFEAWNLVREALVWLGCADPAATRERVLNDDPQKSGIRELFRLWHEALGAQWATVRDISSADHQPKKDLIKELTDMTNSNTFNIKSVGRMLAKNIDRVTGGFVLESEFDSSGTRKYRVRKLHDKPPVEPAEPELPF